MCLGKQLVTDQSLAGDVGTCLPAPSVRGRGVDIEFRNTRQGMKHVENDGRAPVRGQGVGMSLLEATVA